MASENKKTVSQKTVRRVDEAKKGVLGVTKAAGIPGAVDAAHKGHFLDAGLSFSEGFVYFLRNCIKPIDYGLAAIFALADMVLTYRSKVGQRKTRYATSLAVLLASIAYTGIAIAGTILGASLVHAAVMAAPLLLVFMAAVGIWRESAIYHQNQRQAIAECNKKIKLLQKDWLRLKPGPEYNAKWQEIQKEKARLQALERAGAYQAKRVATAVFTTIGYLLAAVALLTPVGGAAIAAALLLAAASLVFLSALKNLYDRVQLSRQEAQQAQVQENKPAGLHESTTEKMAIELEHNNRKQALEGLEHAVSHHDSNPELSIARAKAEDKHQKVAEKRESLSETEERADGSFHM